MSFAPIAVFGFKRAQKLEALFESLSSCREAQSSALYIFLDGAKTEEDRPAVEATREIARREKRFKSVAITEAPRNLGLAESITRGVSKVLQTHDRVIVLEDDLLVSPHFLKYMNDALTAYETTEEVISIHAYRYPTEDNLPSTFFLRGADCWGWGTWRRGWSLYNADSRELLLQLTKSEELHLFDFNGSYAFSQTLRDQIAGKVDSWAVRWYASAFLANKVTLYPNTPLAVNTGTDSSGTHGRLDKRYLSELSASPVRVTWQAPVENSEARRAVEGFFKLTQPKPLTRLAKRLREFVFLSSRVNH